MHVIKAKAINEFSSLALIDDTYAGNQAICNHGTLPATDLYCQIAGDVDTERS